jgi:hypothetical protein
LLIAHAHGLSTVLHVSVISTCHCLLDSVICFIWGCRRFIESICLSNLEGKVVNFADREQVVDDMIGVIGVTAV